jgi:hypothetical protein
MRVANVWKYQTHELEKALRKVWSWFQVEIAH